MYSAILLIVSFGAIADALLFYNGYLYLNCGAKKVAYCEHRPIYHDPNLATCSAEKHQSGSVYYQKCYGYDSGYGYYKSWPKAGFPRHGQTICPSMDCHASIQYGTSRCHGSVRLLSGFTKYEAKQCRYAGHSCSYLGYAYHGYPNGYDYAKCTCETDHCSKSVKACYKHGGYYYEGFVTIKYPCGCRCYYPATKKYPPYYK